MGSIWTPLLTKRLHVAKAGRWITIGGKKGEDGKRSSVSKSIKPTDDQDEKNSLIADILAHVFGDNALKFFGPDAKAKSWKEADHPRGKNGRFIVRGSAEAVTAAKDNIKRALKEKKTPESHKSLAEHLNLLTVKQLGDLKREYNISAAGEDKAALVNKLADRLNKSRRGEEDYQASESPSYKDWAKGERESRKAKEPTPDQTIGTTKAPVFTEDGSHAPGPEAPTPNEPSGRWADVGGTDGGSTGGPDGRRRPRIVTAREHLVKRADPGLVPEGIREHLNETQTQGAAKAIESMEAHGGFLLADGTGTGKTRQQLAVAKYWAKKGKKVLIVSPSEVLKPDWKKRTVSGSFANDSKAMGVDITLNKDEPLKAGGIGLTTYDQIGKLKSQVDADTVVIFDESHSLKNWGSARSKHGYEMAKAAGQVMYATATPADKPLHITHLFRAKVFGGKKWEETYRELGMRQVDVHTGGGNYIKQWQVDPKVGYKECYRRMSGLFDRMIEDGLMLKREISLDGLNVQADRIELPQEAKDSVDRAYKDKLAETGGNKAVALMAARMAQEPHKVPHVTKAVKEELDDGRSVVVFAARVNKSGGDDEEGEGEATEGTMKLLRESLEKSGIDPKDITELHGGATKTAAQKAKAMADFQSGKARVILATIESGGTGVNLDDTVGDRPRTTVVMTPPFSAVSNVQLAGRTWRLNTQSDAKIRHLFADTKIDDWNASLVAKKMKVHGAVVGGEAGKLDVAGDDDDAEFEIGGEHTSPYHWGPLVGSKSEPAKQSTESSSGGSKIKITGDTYTHRDRIKAAGGKWDGDAKLWTIPSDKADALRKLSGLNFSDTSHLATVSATRGLDDTRSTLVVGGNTYAHKDKIKAAGGRWDGSRGVWVVPAHAKDKIGHLSGLRFSEKSLPTPFLVRKSLPGEYDETASPPAEQDEDDDPLEYLEHLADILGGIYGDGALRLFGQDPITKSLTTKAAKAGFTGQIKDKLGRTYHYQNGKRVKGSESSSSALKETKPPAPKKAADQASARDEVKKIMAGDKTPETRKALLGHLGKMTVVQLNAFKKEHGLKASGKLKDQLIAKLADAIHGTGSMKHGQVQTDEAKQASPTPAAETPKAEPRPAPQKPAAKPTYSAEPSKNGRRSPQTDHVAKQMAANVEIHQTVANLAAKHDSPHRQRKEQLAVTERELAKELEAAEKEHGTFGAKTNSIREKWHKQYRELAKIDKMIAAERDQWLDSVLTPGDSLDYAHDGGAPMSGRNRKNFARAKQVFNGLVHPSLKVSDITIGESAEDLDRAGFESGTKTMTISKDIRDTKFHVAGLDEDGGDEHHPAAVATMLHELGHAIEDAHPDVRDASVAFWEKRCGSQPGVTKEGYAPSERGRDDDFGKALGNAAWYAGKVYVATGGKNRKPIEERIASLQKLADPTSKIPPPDPSEIKATEILSMGIEHLYTDPVGFAAKDPEYCAFVLGVIRGKIKGKAY